jgi:hypothetical protein
LPGADGLWLRYEKEDEGGSALADGLWLPSGTEVAETSQGAGRGALIGTLLADRRRWLSDSVGFAWRAGFWATSVRLNLRG